ncbi:MAG: adenylate kinase family protein [Candidatus Saliniplasma sp.]
MTIALTGTPGIGKTTTAALLREKGFKVLDLNEFINKKGLRGERDEDRDSDEVDLSLLKKEFEKILDYDIVDGHLSHHLEISPVIVLRCSPEELRKRMSVKDWPQRKINENLEAEILDVILIEALEYSEEVYEVDTTDMEPVEVRDAVIEIIEGKCDKYPFGQVDWSSEL